MLWHNSIKELLNLCFYNYFRPAVSLEESLFSCEMCGVVKLLSESKARGLNGLPPGTISDTIMWNFFGKHMHVTSFVNNAG